LGHRDIVINEKAALALELLQLVHHLPDGDGVALEVLNANDQLFRQVLLATSRLGVMKQVDREISIEPGLGGT